MTLRVLAEAETEYRSAAQWYEERQPGLGHEFLGEIQLAFQEIASDPSRYPLLETLPSSSPPLRRYLLRRFAYYVVFLSGPDELHVVAVAHGSRNPTYWIGRQ